MTHEKTYPSKCATCGFTLTARWEPIVVSTPIGALAFCSEACKDAWEDNRTRVACGFPPKARLARARA